MNDDISMESSECANDAEEDVPDQIVQQEESGFSMPRLIARAKQFMNEKRLQQEMFDRLLNERSDIKQYSIHHKYYFILKLCTAFGLVYCLYSQIINHNFDNKIDRIAVKFHYGLAWMLWAFVLISLLYTFYKKEDSRKVMQLMGHLMMLRTWLGCFDVQERSIN